MPISRAVRVAVPFGIALVTVLVFAPALWNGFVDWDDDVNLTRNPDFRGLSWTHLRWMLTTTLTGHYIPFTWLSFGFDYRLWGMNPAGYHLTNVVLHAVGAALFALVAARLLSRATAWPPPAVRVAAATAALVFALHPLRVESVAWVTERRDVLSGVFVLLTILGYLHAADATGARRRWLLTASLGAYVLALGSKSIAMALPVVLVVLDGYPLRRFRGGAWSVVVEKLPFLALGGASAIVAYHAVAAAAVLTPFERYSWGARVAMGAYTLAFSLAKTAFPIALSPLYELPSSIDPLAPRFLVSLVAVVAMTALFVLLRRRWPAGLALWSCYVAFLLPVSGLLVHQGPQLVTDRYSYLACLPWALLAGAGVGWLVTAAARGAVPLRLARVAGGVAVTGLVGLGVLSWQQTEVWRDTDTLWRHALDIDPLCSMCHSNLGVFHMNAGDPGTALEHLTRAVALRPDRARYRANLGLVLVKQGRYTEAIPHLERAIEQSPEYVDALAGLGVALINVHRADAALPYLRRAVARKPDHVLARTNLAAALVLMDRAPEAVEQYQRAIALDADAPPPHFGLARAYLALGRRDLAREQYRVVERLDPRLAALMRGAFDE
jgi:Tfp pilus assembly protein PilF